MISLNLVNFKVLEHLLNFKIVDSSAPVKLIRKRIFPEVQSNFIAKIQASGRYAQILHMCNVTFLLRKWSTKGIQCARGAGLSYLLVFLKDSNLAGRKIDIVANGPEVLNVNIFSRGDFLS